MHTSAHDRISLFYRAGAIKNNESDWKRESSGTILLLAMNTEPHPCTYEIVELLPCSYLINVLYIWSIMHIHVQLIKMINLVILFLASNFVLAWENIPNSSFVINHRISMNLIWLILPRYPVLFVTLDVQCCSIETFGSDPNGTGGKTRSERPEASQESQSNGADSSSV